METSLLAVVKNGKIQLPSPLSIPEGTKILIIPIPLNRETENNPETDWEYFALQNLNQCYEDNEPEYPLNRIKEFNKDYAGRVSVQ